LSQVSSSQRSRRWLRGLAAVAAAGILVLLVPLAWLKWHETQLVFETARSRARAPMQLPASATRLTIAESEGNSLAAIIFRADPKQTSGFWVLHLHGNADSAFSALQLRHCEALRALGLNVLGFDYRGFGLSPGVATEENIDEDADAAYQELIRRGVPPGRIIVWGHSLGSGPAVLLATKYPVAALVLFGAFTSIPDAAEDTYPYLPVRWMVSIHFDSLKRMPDIHVPVVIAHSVGDTLIPFHHAQRLFAAANEPKRFLSLNAASSDGFGGHVDALYDNLDQLAALLTTLIGVPLQPSSR
jgi:alpha-beta hydrolase superfamily lysophospholipase